MQFLRISLLLGLFTSCAHSDSAPTDCDIDQPPPVHKGAKLFPSSCFEDEPGFILCGYADNPYQPEACFYLLGVAHCSHPLYNGGHWFEVFKECLPPPEPSFEEKAEEFGF